MAVKRFIVDIFDRARYTKQTNNNLANLVCSIVEKKAEVLREKGEKGPIAHLRYLALKELYSDKAAMKRFLFINGFYIVSRADVERLNKIEDKEEKMAIWKKMDTWEKGLSEAMDGFFDLIGKRAADLSRSMDEDDPYGLRFLALEELIEERECAQKNIRKEDWKRSRFANCTVACIEDVECRIEVDKLLREEFNQKGSSYSKSSVGGWSSHVYDKTPDLLLITKALNSAYKKKRRALIAMGNNDGLRRFRMQEAYHVNIERLIYNYKLKENFTIIYTPYGQTVSHALKVLMIEDGIVLAQDLYTGEDKFDIRRHKIADLMKDGQEITVIMDSDELTEEELSTIVLDQGPYNEPEIERVVDLNYASCGDIYFRVKGEKLKSGSYSFFLKKYIRAYILAGFRDGAYHGVMPVDTFLYNYAHKNIKHDPILYESAELIIQSAKEIKEEYFKEAEELSDEERKAIKTVIYESAK